MALLNRGRLSVQPVTEEAFSAIVALGEKGRRAPSRARGSDAEGPLTSDRKGKRKAGGQGLSKASKPTKAARSASDVGERISESAEVQASTAAGATATAAEAKGDDAAPVRRSQRARK